MSQCVVIKGSRILGSYPGMFFNDPLDKVVSVVCFRV